MIVYVGWKSNYLGPSNPKPVIVLKQFKSGRAYVEFQNGKRRNVDGKDLRLVP